MHQKFLGLRERKKKKKKKKDYDWKCCSEELKAIKMGNDQPLSRRTKKVRLKRENSENHSKYFIKIFFSPEINYRFKVLYEVSQR